MKLKRSTTSHLQKETDRSGEQDIGSTIERSQLESSKDMG
jgi:hypothetical protein